MKEIRRCNYFNCCKIVEGRIDKKFCSKNCRTYYWIYEKRRLNRLKKEKKRYKDMLEMTKLKLDPKALELWEKLYN